MSNSVVKNNTLLYKEVVIQIPDTPLKTLYYYKKSEFIANVWQKKSLTFFLKENIYLLTLIYLKKEKRKKSIVTDGAIYSLSL